MTLRLNSLFNKCAPGGDDGRQLAAQFEYGAQSFGMAQLVRLATS
jgi:hypothetical protein